MTQIQNLEEESLFCHSYLSYICSCICYIGNDYRSYLLSGRLCKLDKAFSSLVGYDRPDRPDGSNNFQAIRRIIWKHYPTATQTTGTDDLNRLDRN